MKKLLIVLVLVFTLSSCGGKEEDSSDQVEYILFAGATYEFTESKDGYDQFIRDQHIVEVQYGRETTITTEIGGDIYIIKGSASEYTISKNGETIVICSGEELICTGFESVEFEQDIIGIIKEYEKK